MHYAVRSRRVQTIDLLYQHGCSIHMVDKCGQTVLHHAVKRKNLDAVRRLLLLDGSSFGDKKDRNGRTPLDMAISNNQAALIELLRSVSRLQTDQKGDGHRPDPCTNPKVRKTQYQGPTSNISQGLFSRGLWQIFVAVTILAFVIIHGVEICIATGDVT